MRAAVKSATQIAASLIAQQSPEEPPEQLIVLLSPACSSLDMYASFAARGHAFVAAVREVCDG